MNKVAYNIRELRIEKNLSQSELAEKVNISQSSIARYELGQTEPKATDIIKLCNFFGVSSDILLGIKDF